jgi:foldase protein PrsA
LIPTIFLFGGCGKNDTVPQIVFTTELKENEIFRIERESCTWAEMRVYLTTTKNQYESVYGEQIWDISQDGYTLEDRIKENVLAKIAQIKTMYLMALDRGVVLTDKEEQSVLNAASDYFDTLNETEIEAMQVDISLIENMYRQYAYASKVYQQIIGELDPEISDDEARIVTVNQIFLEGKTEETVREVNEIYALALLGADDFETLALVHSDSDTITDSFGVGERESAIWQAAFELATEQISPIIETKNGFYILKCVTTLQREETDINKQRIATQRKKEVFGEDYNAYVGGLVRILNEEAWANVTFLQDERITTADFFVCYAKYFI